MTKNTDGDSICSRTAALIAEFERTRDPDSTEIGHQFAQLQRTMMENKDVLSCHEGAKTINRLKNRYKDVLPYDHCRVVLKTESESDYINASYIKDLNGQVRYIAAQGPIEESISDFCRMICSFQITSIICTANDVEAGRFKFRRYWPDEEEPLSIGSYTIVKDQSNNKSYSSNDYEICPLIITREDKQHHVLLYHFLHWPDHDIPNNEASIMDLLSRVYQDRDPSTDSPILVHCSAGCGRTGSIIAIDLCRLFLNDEHLFSNKDYSPYPVFKIASHIRQFRIALIQTLKQYFFVYKIFLFMMKANDKIALCSTENNNENHTLISSSATKLSPPSTISSSSRRPSVPLQIILRDPPIGRRLLNGSNMSNTPSPTVSPSEFFSSSSKSSSHNNTPQTPEPPISPHPTLSKHYEENQSNETGRNSIASKNIRRTKSTNTHSVLSTKYQHRQGSSDQETNSD